MMNWDESAYASGGAVSPTTCFAQTNFHTANSNAGTCDHVLCLRAPLIRSLESTGGEGRWQSELEPQGGLSEQGHG